MDEKEYRHVPTDENKIIVRELYAAGIKKLRIAERLKIDERTLCKYYENELDNHKDHMIGSLAKNLYQDALDGDKASREFWLKCQGRWSYAKPPEDDKKSATEALLEKLIEKL